MQSIRRAVLLLFAFSFAVVSLPVFAQQLIATVPVGTHPGYAAINPVTNKIYVANVCGSNPNCLGYGTVTVIDGATLGTATVTVGATPVATAVNSVTNKIYVANQCGNDVSCSTFSGTVTVIDGATLATTEVMVGAAPDVVTVNPVTNKIYVSNSCGNDPTCQTYSGTVTVIDGVTLATATVNVGSDPNWLAVNSVTNKIYVPNLCGNDPLCTFPYSPGTVTVIDGVSLSTTTVSVGISPDTADVNSMTNKIYVANSCGSDPNCTSTGTVTIIDGATLSTSNVTVGYSPYGAPVNSVTNKIYVSNDCGSERSCRAQATVTVIDGATLATTNVDVGYKPKIPAVNSVTNKVYLANYCGDPYCQNPNGAVTMIDGATLAITHLGVGRGADSESVNSVTNRIYVPNYLDATVSVIDGTPPTALQFVPVTPCRLVDTRPDHGGSGPIQGGTSRDFPIPEEGDCNIPATAAAYSLNVTAVPQGPLGYLITWPAGKQRPGVSTLNSLDGRIKANAAIVAAGTSGAISVYVTNTIDVILDIDGYFAPVSTSTLAFYPLPPCRVADTRKDTFPSGLGMPHLSGGAPRDFPVLNSTCDIPSTAQAYSLNFTVVPYPTFGDPLGYLEVWPKDQMPQHPVSTLNNLTGTIVANAALVAAGTGGEITALASNDTDLVIDIDGYFAPAGPSGLSLYPVAPCRVIDTRLNHGQPFSGALNPPVDVVDTGCGTSSLAQAYVFNATVVPVGGLGYLTLWLDGTERPLQFSTLNAIDGWIASNMAIVSTNNGQVDAYASNLTQLILDISAYFAP